MNSLIIKDKGELKMLEGLFLQGYRHIAKDDDGSVYAYKQKPKHHVVYDECDEKYKYWELPHGTTKSGDYLDSLAFFSSTWRICGYDEPLKIAEILKANGVEI